MVSSKKRLLTNLPSGLSGLILCLSLLIHSVAAQGKNSCEGATLINPAAAAIQSGIGGTGSAVLHSGIGGTGIQPQGIGGTGNPASALLQSGIGGTGARIASGGVGGTGIDDGGIGGTGLQDSGIGGTGSTAQQGGGIGGTGIVGTISGFASICVNGVEIHYDPDTPVSIDGRPASVRELAAGQIVIARASGTGIELTARNIAVVHAAVGPISHINLETRELRVLGQTIHAGSQAHGGLSGLKTGEWVQISGHRLPDGSVAASRIEGMPAHVEAHISGHVTHVHATGFEINGTRIQHDPHSRPNGLAQGMEVMVAGQWDGAHLQARHIQTEPTRHQFGNVSHVVIEGYVHGIRGKELNLSNRTVTINEAQASVTKDELKPGRLVQMSGRISEDQRVVADRIETKQELPIQIQDRIDRAPLEGNNLDRRNNADSEPELKSIRNDDHRGRDDSQNDDSSRGKDDRSDRHDTSGRSDSSGSGSRSDDSDRSGRSGSDHKVERSDSIKHDRDESGHDRSDSRDLQSPDKPDRPDERHTPRDHVDSSRDHIQDKPDLPDKRDHGGHDARAILQDAIDLSDRVHDHGGRHDRHFDR